MSAARRITIGLLTATLVAGITDVVAQEQGSRQDRVIAGIAAAKGVSVTLWAINLDGPRRLLADRAGGLWVAEENAGRVVKVSATGRVTRLAEGLLAEAPAP